MDWETVLIDLSGPVEQVWAGLSGLYTFDPLGAAAMAGLRDAFIAETRETITAEGTVPFGFKVNIATAQLR